MNRWRPISTAPKDAPILLLYQGHDHLPFVCQGRWVEWPHRNPYLDSLGPNGKPLRSDDHEGRWQIGYIATFGDQSRISHWCAESYLVFPTHWQPLPKPPKRLPKGYAYP